jgi:4a-hydroxytetrahydrobiopterin dehydratase
MRDAADLASRHCAPCREGTPPLPGPASEENLARLHGDWRLREDGKEIERSLPFENYHQVMAFVNALAWVSHREDHHPDLSVHYSKVVVRYSTHSVGGLSENDFICAAKLDALLETP